MNGKQINIWGIFIFCSSVEVSVEKQIFRQLNDSNVQV